jgi:hypothetical protein
LLHPCCQQRDKEIVSCSPRQSWLVSAVTVAVLVLGGARSCAGYISVSTTSDNDLGGSVAFMVHKAHEELPAVCDNSQSRPVSDDPYVPSVPTAPSRKLPLKSCWFGHRCMGGTSRPVSGNSSNNPPIGQFSWLYLPTMLMIAQLRPQAVGAHPPFAASSLFRPPRAR